MFGSCLDLLGDDRVGDQAVLVVCRPEVDVEHGREGVLPCEVEEEPVPVDVGGEGGCYVYKGELHVPPCNHGIGRHTDRP